MTQLPTVGPLFGPKIGPRSFSAIWQVVRTSIIGTLPDRARPLAVFGRTVDRVARHAGHWVANRKAAAAGVQSAPECVSLAPATEGWHSGLRLRQQQTGGTRRLRSYKQRDGAARGVRRWPCPPVASPGFSCRSTTDPANLFWVLLSWLTPLTLVKAPPLEDIYQTEHLYSEKEKGNGKATRSFSHSGIFTRVRPHRCIAYRLCSHVPPCVRH